MPTYYCNLASTGTGHAGTALDPFTFDEMQASIETEIENGAIYKCKGATTTTTDYFAIENSILEPWEPETNGPPRIDFTVCNDVYMFSPGSITGFILNFNDNNPYLDCEYVDPAFLECWIIGDFQYYEAIFHKCVIFGNLSSVTPINDPLALSMHDCIVVGTITSHLNNILTFVNCCTTGSFTGTGTSVPESVTNCQSGWTCLLPAPSWDSAPESFLYSTVTQGINTPPQFGTIWGKRMLWGDKSKGIGTGFVPALPSSSGGYGDSPGGWGDQPYLDEAPPPAAPIAMMTIDAIKIPLFENGIFSETVTLDGNNYGLTFAWNTRAQAWFMNIADGNGTILRTGLRLNIGYPVLLQFNDVGLPTGDFVLIDQNPATALIEPGRNDFTAGRKLELLYISRA